MLGNNKQTIKQTKNQSTLLHMVSEAIDCREVGPSATFPDMYLNYTVLASVLGG
jgi:hypothetical protein